MFVFQRRFSECSIHLSTSILVYKDLISRWTKDLFNSFLNLLYPKPFIHFGHFFSWSCTHSSLVGIFVHALLGIQLGLLCLVCGFLIVSFLQSLIGLMSRVFTNGLGDRGSIPGGVIPETQEMVLDATLLNTQHY